MMLLARGANIGGFSARGLVTAAAAEVGEGAVALASRSLPISDASAVAPTPIWQRRRKWRRVTSWEYLWCRFISVASSLTPLARAGTLMPRFTPRHPFVSTESRLS